MTTEEKMAFVGRVYGLACAKGICKNRTEFARLLEINPSSLSAAMGTRPEYLTDKLIGRIAAFATANGLSQDSIPDEPEAPSVLVIPYGARGGTIGDFLDGVHEYDCERITSPIKGADYAMEVTGDSMSPEYPSGSRVLIKRVDETAFIAWNEVYVLDTPNGAVIKRVRKTGDPSVVECVSVNPAYQPYTIPRDFIRGWYRVLMVMALK
jgi:phage repressor protein C with HTH and peptisase S24 domain